LPVAVATPVVGLILTGPVADQFTFTPAGKPPTLY
jgi:hypothetical protein